MLVGGGVKANVVVGESVRVGSNPLEPLKDLCTTRTLSLEEVSARSTDYCSGSWQHLVVGFAVSRRGVHL